jgi:S1-C subfamily serine protease
MTGSSAEVKAEMTRLSAMQVGASTLMDALVESNQDELHEYATASGLATVGLLGGETFKGTRVGIDYVHSTLYVEPVTGTSVAGLDVVGLTLRPEVDGRYTIVAVVQFEDHPAVADVRVGDVLVGVDDAPVTGATMGQVWSLLGGEPGQSRKLIVERDGKRLTVEVPVRRFLGTKAN